MKQKFYKPLFGDQIFSFGDGKKFFSRHLAPVYPKKVNFGPCQSIDHNIDVVICRL